MFANGVTWRKCFFLFLTRWVCCVRVRYATVRYRVAEIMIKRILTWLLFDSEHLNGISEEKVVVRRVGPWGQRPPDQKRSFQRHGNKKEQKLHVVSDSMKRFKKEKRTTAKALKLKESCEGKEIRSVWHPPQAASWLIFNFGFFQVRTRQQASCHVFVWLSVPLNWLKVLPHS